MKTKEFNLLDITEDEINFFEKQGWSIFNGNEIERIDNLLDWINEKNNTTHKRLPKGYTQLKNDKQAVLLAEKFGFKVYDNNKRYIITDVKIKK